MMISNSIRWSLAGIRRRLDDENVGAADVFLDFDEDFHVGEAPHHRLGQRRAEIAADGFGQRRIGIAGDELDRAVVARHSIRLLRPSFAGLIQAARKAGNLNSVLVRGIPNGERLVADGALWEVFGSG